MNPNINIKTEIAIPVKNPANAGLPQDRAYVLFVDRLQQYSINPINGKKKHTILKIVGAFSS